MRWAWTGFQSSLLGNLKNWLVVGLVVGLAFGLVVGLVDGLVVGLFVVLGNRLAGGLSGGLTTEVLETRTMPNEGIRRTFRNALYSMLVAGLFGGLFLGLFGGLVDGLAFGLVGGLVGGLSLGLVGGLLKGGSFCIQHFIIRMMLVWNDFAPRHYANFLDYADGRILLRKVGGGYSFIHRYLLEYFAHLDIQNSQVKRQDSPTPTV